MIQFHTSISFVHLLMSFHCVWNCCTSLLYNDSL